MAKKRVNSKQKGKRWELEACKFLRGLGFDVYRSAQHKGNFNNADLCGPGGTPLPVHIEIKSQRKMHLGTKLLDDACIQAIGDCGIKWWCVLWWEYKMGWRLTTPVWRHCNAQQDEWYTSTVAGDAAIAWSIGLHLPRKEDARSTNAAQPQEV